MKRSYSCLDPKERQKQAQDEAFYALPDGPLRSAILAFFLKRETRESLPHAATEWLSQRGL